ncbi:MAG: MaoC family dehydratase N-terminal domain-containing protein [Rhodobacteraceae bacterium]|nr:MaoC family dehydratase N-terminal domain-containing protein [Paracoccaceae bacterium]
MTRQDVPGGPAETAGTMTAVTVDDRIDPARAAALHAALQWPGTAPGEADPLPHFWHQIYFWDARPPTHLGVDGHVKPGAFIPDFGLQQRMWAGGSLESEKPLIAGRAGRRISRIEEIAEKHGQSGPLKFVTVRHEIVQDGLCAVERQQLVYRNATRLRTASSGKAPSHCESFICDEVTLFRFSALTFNSHRIHYDADYCRQIAGYPAPVVHGPLLAMRLARLAVATGGEFRRFTYRATGPAFCGERILLWADTTDDRIELSAGTADGRVCMTARAEGKQA